MKSIQQSYQINAPIGKVWQALVDPKLIKKWTGQQAVMDDQVGTQFKLWGGDIHGTTTKVIIEQLLEQDWYAGDWPKASKLRITLSLEEKGTQVDLVHEGVPENEFDSISKGWKDYYFGAIKKLLEK